MVRRKRLWVQQSGATPFLKTIRGYVLMQDTLWWNFWYTFFFKKSTLFGKYRMLPKSSRLGAGSVKNYVDELIQFFLNSFIDFINSLFLSCKSHWHRELKKQIKKSQLWLLNKNYFEEYCFLHDAPS